MTKDSHARREILDFGLCLGENESPTERIALSFESTVRILYIHMKYEYQKTYVYIKCATK